MRINPLHKRFLPLRAVFTLAICMLLLFGCESTPQKPGDDRAVGGGLNALTEAQRASYQQAIDNLNDKKPEAAEKRLSKLLTKHDNVGELWLNLALCQYQQEKYPQAGVSINKLMSLSNNIAQAHNLAGLLAVRQGEFDSAATHYQKAISLQQNYANALYNMALLQDVYLQDVKTAISFYEQYVAINTEDQRTKDWIEQLKASL